MHIETGNIVPLSELEEMPPRERKNYIEVVRELTPTESLNRQIRLYSPCGCGSGKKFKFCCKV